MFFLGLHNRAFSAYLHIPAHPLLSCPPYPPKLGSRWSYQPTRTISGPPPMLCTMPQAYFLILESHGQLPNQLVSLLDVCYVMGNYLGS